MTTPHALWAELEATFKLDIPATSQLLTLLQQERKALEQRHYDQLQTLIEQKQPLIKQLETNTYTRQQLLQQAGFDNEKSTLNAAQQEAPSTATAWHQLAEQWKKCQQLNEINERIAQRTRLVVGKVLDLVRGQNGTDKLYTASGNTRGVGAGRSITNA